jgi:CRP-like cAMP-binding protein
MSEVMVSLGTSLIKQEEAPKNVFIILHGSIKIHLNTTKGTEYLVALEGPGHLIGEIEALETAPATCSVTALTESRVAKISHKAYRRWIEEDHSFALLVNRIITHRLKRMTQRAATHLSYPLEYSVLKLLKMLAVKKDSDTLHISINDIANYLGTNVRSINRILNELRIKKILPESKAIDIISIENLDKAMRAHDE